MDEPVFQGLGGLCANCDKEWKTFVVEWPPKVVICPTCSDVMVLREYHDNGAAIYQRIAYEREDSDE